MVRSTKVAFILTGGYYSSLYFSTKAIVEKLRTEGLSVDYVFYDDPKIELKDTDKYVAISGIGEAEKGSVKRLSMRLLKMLLGRHKYYYLRSQAFSQRMDAELSGYDCAFVHSMACIPFSNLNMPHYIVVHSCKYENLVAREKWPRDFFAKLFYRSVYSHKNLLTVSDSARIDMLQKLRAKPNFIETIYNGFDFNSLVARAENGKTEGVPEKFIMAAGRPDRTKRFDILIKAYAKTQRTHKLVIFGEGRKLKVLKKLSESLGVADDVIFWGYCKNLLPYFKQASAYVLSSDIEGLPTVVVESLALGTPVVATDAGGVNELLSGRLNEWVVPRGDIDALAAKIDLILEAPPKVGPEDIAFLDYRKVTEHYMALSEKLCD